MGIEKMSFSEAHEEASRMKDKIKNNDTDNYYGAEMMINKIKIDEIGDLNYEKIEKAIPEVREMKNFNQRSDFHSLPLDEHTKQVNANLEKDEYISSLSDEERSLVLLAAKLHDLGKVSPEGSQVHPQDPDKRQYVGHEKESEQTVRKILPKYFDMKPENIELVAKLAGLHASALNLVNNFENNKQPKGKELKAYDKFFSEVESIPGDMNIEKKMRIVFALNKADKMAGYNDQSDMTDNKVKNIIKNVETQVETLKEMEKALPALIEAIKARRAGDQKAGIVLKGGEYKYIKPEEKKKVSMPAELKRLGGVLRDKTKDVAEVYDALKSKKDNEKAFENMVNGLLIKKIGLNDEQVEAVVSSIK